MTNRLKEIIKRVGPDINSKLDILILYIISRLYRDKPVSEMKIQKILYLFNKYDKSLSESIKFEPHLKGAYSEEISLSITKQINNGLFESKPHPFSDRLLIPTEDGEIFLKFIKDNINGMIPKKSRELFDSILDFVDNLSDEEFLIYIYTLYPRDTVHSELKSELLNRRIDLALSMYRKGKISLTMASKIAGLPINKLIEIMRKKGIRIPLSE